MLLDVQLRTMGGRHGNNLFRSLRWSGGRDGAGHAVAAVARGVHAQVRDDDRVHADHTAPGCCVPVLATWDVAHVGDVDHEDLAIRFAPAGARVQQVLSMAG